MLGHLPSTCTLRRVHIGLIGIPQPRCRRTSTSSTLQTSWRMGIWSSPSNPDFDGLHVRRDGSGLLIRMSGGLIYACAPFGLEELYSSRAEGEQVAWVERVVRDPQSWARRRQAVQTLRLARAPPRRGPMAFHCVSLLLGEGAIPARMAGMIGGASLRALFLLEGLGSWTSPSLDAMSGSPAQVGARG